MNYRAILTANSQDDIRRMPPAVARFTLLQLKNLQESPTSLSVRSHFPFREKCQLFSFDYDWEGRRYFINVLFQYGTDETRLIILDAPWQVADEWWEG
jgi:hypothetical protein